MVNLKSLFAILAVISLMMAAIGLVRFGVDLWGYFHASTGITNLPNNHPNCRGLAIALMGVILFGIFISLFRGRKR
jgi:hypothetical protein